MSRVRLQANVYGQGISTHRILVALLIVLFLGTSTSCYAASAASLNVEGFAHFKKGQFVQAIGKFTQAIALDKKSAEAYHGRAVCYGALKKAKESISDFDMASTLYLQRGDKDKASRMKQNAAGIRQLYSDYLAKDEAAKKAAAEKAAKKSTASESESASKKGGK